MSKDVCATQLDKLLGGSKALEAFKAAVRRVARGDTDARIETRPVAPSIKVLRVLLKVLESYPECEISALQISGESTCSAYRGYVVIDPGRITIEFDWDCRWKAEQQGWTAWYGAPDQSRAAREFGYQCFKRFQVAPQ
jgi:hypothetical protein